MLDVLKKVLQPLLIAIASVFLPIKTVLATVAVLVFVDLILGVWSAYKQGDKITSADLRRSVSKVVVYELVICAGFLAETYLMGDILPLTKLLATLLASVELKSILENANIIAGNDIFKTLIEKLGSENQSK